MNSRKTLGIIGGLASLLFLTLPQQGFGYKILYAEQFYKLFHQHLYQYPERIAENISYLQSALKADFANPLYALARIPDKVHWERYRYLFKMHVNLKIIEQILLWGSKYQKQVAYFYNAPWWRQNLESLDQAEALFRSALPYWEEAKAWSAKASKLSYLHLEEIQAWEDENHRIETGDLNYDALIQEHLAKVDRVRKAFLAMDASTY
ncbi:MAG: hypothetical protein SNJ78_08150 [Spirochaetales bacterium]